MILFSPMLASVVAQHSVVQMDWIILGTHLNKIKKTKLFQSSTVIESLENSLERSSKKKQKLIRNNKASESKVSRKRKSNTTGRTMTKRNKF